MQKRQHDESYVQFSSPDWCKDAVIYQVNTRQFSDQGTFEAVQSHLPRLKKLGIDILWLMPIHPIGVKNRKGSLGSPYSVKDYFAVNPDLGDLASLKRLVSAAHDLGMKVILDWVANHSAWDNVLVDSHPEWYARDQDGNFTPTPWWDWDDIIDFDYRHFGLREYMLKAMCYWVEQADIDGYRCDVAGFVPNDFWRSVRQQLTQIKPIFMLAEWESKDLHQHAFDMTYAWSWNEIMHNIAMQKGGLNKLFKYYSWNQKNYPKQAHRMTFVSNHDKNAWDGTQFEQFSDCLPPAIVLSVLGEGMPLIYNGQEAGSRKRLAFFDKDCIEWQEHEIGELYRRLIKLKKSHSALHNAHWGATMLKVVNNCPESVFSFIRQDTNSKVFVVLNLSARPQSVTFNSTLLSGQFMSVFDDTDSELNSELTVNLAPWDYKVYVS
ncbi:alpha-amylase family glycosyl hydrolase [Aliiglaciecola sp. LCG003]|uniref:alpha-amylase family glycosyl hydrolase n=1 Tax=Aliiglaciecola sp. LCG003 TaxID=3053655 RepID=UPI002573EC41|nr:alpha-amylase family glycosyl hydrolase [Aliiglaciecola sp. LCG003]WJG08225.1 alpha-amylase family glycosyl hydrolase [Aliiglaciecola sp. LCG003]